MTSAGELGTKTCWPEIFSSSLAGSSFSLGESGTGRASAQVDPVLLPPLLYSALFPAGPGISLMSGY